MLKVLIGALAFGCVSLMMWSLVRCSGIADRQLEEFQKKNETGGDGDAGG